MKYRLQDGFDKIHSCVIVVINDDVPHAWTFYLYFVLFEEIEFRFIEGFKWVWILFLGEPAAEYFCHTNPSSIRNLKPLRWLLARPIPAPIRIPLPGDVPATLIWGGACLITCSRSEEIHPLVSRWAQSMTRSM